MVLDIISGKEPTGKHLELVNGATTAVRLDAGLLREAAAARGAQQAMYSRVEALLQAADGECNKTQLQEALESGLQSLRSQAAAGGPTASSTRILWHVLGRPRLWLRPYHLPSNGL